VLELVEGCERDQRTRWRDGETAEERSEVERVREEMERMSM
jgi:hypothetical protein